MKFTKIFFVLKFSLCGRVPAGLLSSAGLALRLHAEALVGTWSYPRAHTHTHRHFYLCFVLVFAALRGWGLVWLPGDTLSLSQVMHTVLQPNSSPSTGASVRAGPTHSQQYVFFIGRNTRLQLHAVVYS